MNLFYQNSKFSFTYVCLVLAPLLWGGNFVVGGFLQDDIPGALLNLLRWIVAFCILAPFCFLPVFRYRKALFANWHKVCVLAALGVAGFNTFLYSGLSTASVSAAAIAFSLTPLLIFAMGSWLARRLPRPRYVIAAGLSLSGVLIIQTGDGAGLVSDTRGVVLIALAALIWAAYCIALQEFALPMPAAIGFFAQIAVGIVIQGAIVVLLGVSVDLSGLDAQTWLGVGYLGLFAGALAFYLWQLGLRRSNAEAAGIFINLVPLSALILSWALLGEQLDMRQVLGAALIFAGLMLLSTSSARPDRGAHGRAASVR